MMSITLKWVPSGALAVVVAEQSLFMALHVVDCQPWSVQVVDSHAKLEHAHPPVFCASPDATSMPFPPCPLLVVVDGVMAEYPAAKVPEQVGTAVPYEQVTPAGQQPRKQVGVLG